MKTSPLERDLTRAAQSLASVLRKKKVRIVFAESCTAGLMSATLGRVPGISDWLCGSAVVYREATKTRWLGVSAAGLKRFGAVSAETALAMAEGALRSTPEADIAVSITGRLGPSSRPAADGVAYAAFAFRKSRRAFGRHALSLEISRSQRASTALRIRRQRLAATACLLLCVNFINNIK